MRPAINAVALQVPSRHARAARRAGHARPVCPRAAAPRPARSCSDRCRAAAQPALERPPREGVRGPGPDRKLGQGRRRAERTRRRSDRQAPCRALRGAAPLYREQRGRADRLRPARPGRQADLVLTCGRHRQSAGQHAHEQATANALVAPRRPPCASGQGRSAGRERPEIGGRRTGAV